MYEGHYILQCTHTDDLHRERQREIERDRERQRETDRQTDRQRMGRGKISENILN